MALDDGYISSVPVNDARRAALTYGAHGHDRVRATFERAWFKRAVSKLLARAGGGRLLDLGCGDGLVAELAGPRLRRYLGLDLDPPEPSGEARVEYAAHDLRRGLGPVDELAFDVYLASFGMASHLAPDELRRLVFEIGAHGRPGSLVALEALGLYSLEWPSIWESEPGVGRTLPYSLGAQVDVHPWSPEELRELYEAAGIAWLGAVDRTLQAGPKTGEGRYGPSLPALRPALNGLLEGDPRHLDALSAPLPPLPAHAAAEVHHELARRRRALTSGHGRRLAPPELAREVWALEPASGGGFGHGLLAIGRVAGSGLGVGAPTA